MSDYVISFYSFTDLIPPQFGACLFDPYMVYYQEAPACDAGMAQSPQGINVI